MTPDLTITGYAPTAYNTGKGLADASTGLERLLKLAVGGYTSVLQAKSDATKAKLELADANRSGVPSQPVTAQATGFTVNPKLVLAVAAGIAAVIVGASLLRQKP